MVESLNAGVIGTGRAGCALIRGLAQRDDFQLTAVTSTTPEKSGVDAGILAGIDSLGLPVTAELDEVLARSGVDVVFYAGLGSPTDIAAIARRAVRSSKDFITVSGLIHPPTALGSAEAADLDAAARQGGGRILGAGWNPGFLLDVLPVVWGWSCLDVARISAKRVGEMRDWGDRLLAAANIGLPIDSPSAGEEQLHLSLAESVALISDALGLAITDVEETTRPYPAPTQRSHKGILVEPGAIAGFLKRAVGHRGGTEIIVLEWLAIFCIDPAADGTRELAEASVQGDTLIETSATGTFLRDGYPATVARAIRSARPLRSLPPGLYRPDQLPLSVRDHPANEGAPI